MHDSFSLGIILCWLLFQYDLQNLSTFVGLYGNLTLKIPNHISGPRTVLKFCFYEMAMWYIAGKPSQVLWLPEVLLQQILQGAMSQLS